MRTTGNTVFIVGATSGIGLAFATRLQAKGNRVVVGGRRSDLLDSLAAEHGFATVRIDTTDPANIRSTAARVLAEHPDLNVLITMAGVMEPEDWRHGSTFLDIAERAVATNLLGPIRLIAAFVKQLSSRPNAAIMTVSSGLAWIPYAETPTYNATKAAIHMLSESIRLQLTEVGIQVIELAPPAVRTALFPGGEDNEHAMDVDAFADEAITLLERDPEAREILVESVQSFRFAGARGEYDDLVDAINGG
jgi:uncharacterized oxidoreductase